jgi:hypothetical protein
VLAKAVRVRQEPLHERRDVRADMPAQSIKQVWRTGKELEEIQEWVNNHFPAQRETVT